MSEVTGLQLTTSVVSKQRRLQSLLAGGEPDAPDLVAAVTDAQILGSLELAGLNATWDEMQASRRGEAAPGEIAALRRAVECVPPDDPLDRSALSRWHAALFGGGGRFRTADASHPFEPPPAPGELVAARLEIVGEWLNGESARQLHPPQIGALAMARLVEISPFERGNGRVARLAASHVMTRAGARPPILVGGDRPRLEGALQAAFRFETEALTTLLEEASDRCLDVLIEAVRARKD